MDRMMRDMDRFVRSHEFHDNFDNYASNFLEAPRNKNNSGNSLRDRMLKSDEDTRRGYGDMDFDDKVARYGLQSVIDPNDEKRRPEPNFSHFASSSSFRKVITSDGRVEEHRVQRDSRGNKVETLTRSLGDKVYSVTKKQDPTGQVEENQNLYNLGEEELKDFENHWSRGSGFNRPIQQQPAVDYDMKNDKQNAGYSIMDKVFGWFKK